MSLAECFHKISFKCMFSHPSSKNIQNSEPKRISLHGLCLLSLSGCLRSPFLALWVLSYSLILLSKSERYRCSVSTHCLRISILLSAFLRQERFLATTKWIYFSKRFLSVSSIDGIYIQPSADLYRIWFTQIFAVPSN